MQNGDHPWNNEQRDSPTLQQRRERETKKKATDREISFQQFIKGTPPGHQCAVILPPLAHHRHPVVAHCCPSAFGGHRESGLAHIRRDRVHAILERQLTIF